MPETKNQDLETRAEIIRYHQVEYKFEENRRTIGYYINPEDSFEYILNTNWSVNNRIEIVEKDTEKVFIRNVLLSYFAEEVGGKVGKKQLCRNSLPRGGFPKTLEECTEEQIIKIAEEWVQASIFEGLPNAFEHLKHELNAIRLFEIKLREIYGEYRGKKLR